MSSNNLSRKHFLKLAGISAAGAFALNGCELNSIPPDPPPPLNLGPDPRPNDFALYLGADDTGLFNLIYAVEQFEAAFFTTLLENPYSGMTEQENRILDDIRQHEVAHRDFFNTFLAENGIPQLNFEFFSTDFSSRQSVLRDARQFEDVVVSMYNKFGELFINPDYLNTIIKIASVEGRHAAAIRNLLQPNSTFFIGSDIITPNGLDAVNSPVDVVNLLSPYIVENIDIADVPNS